MELNVIEDDFRIIPNDNTIQKHFDCNWKSGQSTKRIIETS